MSKTEIETVFYETIGQKGEGTNINKSNRNTNTKKDVIKHTSFTHKINTSKNFWKKYNIKAEWTEREEQTHKNVFQRNKRKSSHGNTKKNS